MAGIGAGTVAGSPSTIDCGSGDDTVNALGCGWAGAGRYAGGGPGTRSCGV